MSDLNCTFLIVGLAIIVFILIIGVCVLWWRLFDLCNLKEELKHKKELEKMRMENKKELKEYKSEKEKLKEELKQEFDKTIKNLVEKKIDKTLIERVKDIEEKLDKK